MSTQDTVTTSSKKRMIIPGDKREDIWKTRYEFIRGSLQKSKSLAEKVGCKDNANVYDSIIDLMDNVEMEI